MQRSDERVILIGLVLLSLVGLVLILYYVFVIVAAIPEPVPNSTLLAVR